MRREWRGVWPQQLRREVTNRTSIEGDLRYFLGEDVWKHFSVRERFENYVVGRRTVKDQS